MTESIHNLINALREELQQYGEMLALLDRQQESVTSRAADDVFQSVSLIQAQGAAIQQARRRREECRRIVAQEATLPADATFAKLIPALQSAYRPLVGALVDENNALLVRVQQRARQNHLLLTRSVEFMQNLLNTLLPTRETRVYNGQGAMQTHFATPRSRYEAVG